MSTTDSGRARRQLPRPGRFLQGGTDAAQRTTKRTRDLLRSVVEAGIAAEGAVDRFRERARNGIAAFDIEVDRLGLPDDECRKVAQQAGVQTVFDWANRITVHIDSLTGRSA